jgi:nitroimidazol reductase NimA-like FMN-containing flavoprotein (pyridoxamine 5'-phosphate oxidase superfamily)
MSRFKQTERTTLKRLPKRAEYERDKVYEILDEGFICHVGFVFDGHPYVIPTGYARVEDNLYIHGSSASRMLRTLKEAVEVCVTVTLMDGLVLARSAFHHSVNYRSVVILAKAVAVEDLAEKMEALRAFTEHIVPGRWDEVREPDEGELRATLVLSLPLVEASAKIRTGPPIDDEPDYEIPVWAGELPLHLTTGELVADPRLKAGTAVPRYLREYSRVRKQLEPAV